MLSLQKSSANHAIAEARDTNHSSGSPKHLCEKVRVYLFGSRLDNTKRGGDIDLLVRTNEAKKGVLARIRMIAQLKYLLGDQKIDVIGDHEDSIVAQEALRKGVLLT